MIDFIVHDQSTNTDGSSKYWGHSSFHFIPEHLVTREAAIRAFEFSVTPEELVKIPLSFMDKDFFLSASTYLLSQVPEDILDYDIYFDAVSKKCRNFLCLPKKLKSQGMTCG